MVDGVTIAVVTASAATDLYAGKIFNVVTYSAMLLGLGFAAAGLGPPLSSAILGLLAAGLPLYLLFAIGWMGGGDVKLLAAIGALKGLTFVAYAMFYSIFFGGAFAALVLIWRGESAAVAADLSGLVRRAFYPGHATAPLVPRGGAFPFGVAIALGTVVALVLEWTA